MHQQSSALARGKHAIAVHLAGLACASQDIVGQRHGICYTSRNNGVRQSVCQAMPIDARSAASWAQPQRTSPIKTMDNSRKSLVSILGPWFGVLLLVLALSAGLTHLREGQETLVEAAETEELMEAAEQMPTEDESSVEEALAEESNAGAESEAVGEDASTVVTPTESITSAETVTTTQPVTETEPIAENDEQGGAAVDESADAVPVEASTTITNSEPITEAVEGSESP